MENEGNVEQSNSNPSNGSADDGLSKRKLRKLAKKERLLSIRKDLRRKHKEKMKLKKQMAKETGTLSLAPSRKALKLNKVVAEKSDFKIAIDLSFEHLMTEKDSSKCVAQLLRIYSANRRAKNPLPIYFTSLKEGSTLYNHLEKNDGWKKWDITATEDSYLDCFERDKIVYLTSESENVLNELEKGVCYVIGGLVDHNFHKGVTYDLATKNAIKTARFPLDENIVLNSRKVLTVNQAFEILLGIAEGNSWKDVLLQVLPARKNPKPKEDKTEIEIKQENSAT